MLIVLQHYLWASGHFLLLISSLRYFFAWITFKGVSAWWYKGERLPFLVPLPPHVDFIRAQQVSLVHSLATPLFASQLSFYLLALICR
jgi:hypothetical protein